MAAGGDDGGGDVARDFDGEGGPGEGGGFCAGGVLGEDAAHGQAGVVFDAFGDADDDAGVGGERGGGLAVGLGGDGNDNAFGAVNGVGKVAFEGEIGREFDAGEETVVAVGLTKLF